MFTVEIQSALKAAAKNCYWRRSDAEMVLAFWRQSGQGMSAFAREWDINVARLRRWRTELAGQELPTFHPVAVVEQSSPAMQVSAEAGAVDIVVGQRRVVARPGFDDATLVRVLPLLDAAC